MNTGFIKHINTDKSMKVEGSWAYFVISEIMDI